jgi:hypothetical protein
VQACRAFEPRGHIDRCRQRLSRRARDGRFPSGVVAIPIASVPQLETYVVWRKEEQSASVAAFMTLAEHAFAQPAELDTRSV